MFQFKQPVGSEKLDQIHLSTDTDSTEFMLLTYIKSHSVFKYEHFIEFISIVYYALQHVLCS